VLDAFAFEAGDEEVGGFHVECGRLGVWAFSQSKKPRRAVTPMSGCRGSIQG
jgi:hypothetical protein